jgi:hypothetical protein
MIGLADIHPAEHLTVYRKEPADFINLPPSPAFFSILQINVPSGIASKDKIFLAVAVAPIPDSIFSPTAIPCGAGP